MGRWIGRGANPAPTMLSKGPLVRHGSFCPEAPEQPDLFVQASPSRGEILRQRLVLDGVPAGGEAESEAPFAEDVDLGGLLREQGRLALRGDDDAGHEFHAGDRRQEPVEDEGFVESRVHVIGARPARMRRRVGPEDVIVDSDVLVAELLDLPDIGPDGTSVRRQLRLRIDDAYLHISRRETAM